MNSNRSRLNMLAASLIAIGVGLACVPMTSVAADSDSASTKVSDSVITTKVKSELAAKKLSTLVHIDVTTDHNGVVTLSGTAPSRADVDTAVATARSVDGVKSVENHVRIGSN